MKVIGVSLLVVAAIIALCLLAGIPYVAYIGIRYGWLDDRISWAPLGMAGAVTVFFLARLSGLFLGDSK